MKIIPFENSHSAELSDFMNKHFSRGTGAATRRAIDSSHYVWKYGETPRGPGVAFICREKGQICGLYGAVPKTVSVRNREVSAFEVVDAFVAPEQQGKGIFGALAKTVYAEIDERAPIVYGVSPTPKIFPIHVNKYKFYSPFHARNYILILNFERGFRSCDFPGILSSILGRPLSRCMAAFQSLDSGRRKRLQSVQELGSFPEDDMFSGSATPYDFAVLKDRQYLQWRYVLCPEPYRIFHCTFKNGRKAYFVGKSGTWRTCKITYIVDLIADLRNPDVRKGLLEAIVEIMQKENHDIISFDFASQFPLAKDMKSRGFIRRREQLPFIVRQDTFNFLRPESIDFDLKKWSFFPGDGTDI